MFIWHSDYCCTFMISKFLSFLTNPDKRFVVSLEFTILALILFYFVVLFFSEYQTLGLKNPIIDISPLIKQIADVALYLMLVLLTFELVLKYMKIRNWRKYGPVSILPEWTMWKATDGIAAMEMLRIDELLRRASKDKIITGARASRRIAAYEDSNA